MSMLQSLSADATLASSLLPSVTPRADLLADLRVLVRNLRSRRRHALCSTGAGFSLGPKRHELQPV